MSFLDTLWKDLTGVANSAEDLYKKLTTEEQQAAQWASGTLAIINNNITVDGKYLIPIIQSKFPNVSLDSITVVLKELGSFVNTTPPATLEDAISAIQAYLQPKTGNAWITAVQGLVNLAGTVLSPQTPVQKLVAVAEYVYQDIITPLLGLHKSAPQTFVNAPVGTQLPDGNVVVENPPVSEG